MKTQPTFGHGKICYLELPSVNSQASADFFEKVFNWRIRRDNSDHIAFDDGVGEVSGVWVKGRQPQQQAGIVISIMVEDALAASEAITANGGTILKPVGDPSLHEKVAIFKDPDGNVWSIYQHGG
jgi:uncharacterized protein